MAIPTRAEIDALIRQRLAEDPDFRQALVDDPRGTLSGLVGTALPDVLKVTVHEESLTDVHLVIPPSVDEISEDDLELVAGGLCWINTSSCDSMCT